jgi:S1-C subfamily serine protease
VVKVNTSDVVNDLTLLQIPGTVNDTAAINADPAKLRQGDDIVVFGFPLNSVLSSGGNLTPGIISALTGLGNNTSQIQITAPIQPGSSGSPVLNKKGEVVGVVSMKLSDSKMAKATGQVGQNVNFAVSGQTLKSFLDAHKIEYSKGSFMPFDKSTADLADEAKKWTTVVECWK